VFDTLDSTLLFTFIYTNHLAYQVPFTVGLFFSHFSFMWCGGAPGYFPRLPTPTLSFLLFLDDTTRIQQHNTHGTPIRSGIRTLLTSRWCRKSVALPSTTLPSPLIDIHTHPWPPAEVPSFEKILPLR
jgi:hypothetical protein